MVRELKKIFKLILSYINYYPSIKTSKVYDIYIRLFYPENFDRTRKQIDTLDSLIGSNNKEVVIFDVGANIGRKARTYRKVAEKVILVEPNKQCARWLSKLFQNDNTIKIVQKAVGSRKGKQKMYLPNDKSPLGTLSQKRKTSLEETYTFENEYVVDVITLDSLIEEYGCPDYLKLDVEGYEADALKGLNEKIDLISFEANLPEFREEALDCLDLIHDLGSKVRFTYSTTDELVRDELGQWSGYDSFRHLVKTTDINFMEIVAHNQG